MNENNRISSIYEIGPWTEDMEKHPLTDNKETFIYEGYACTIMRSLYGTLCGYIDIPVCDRAFNYAKPTVESINSNIMLAQMLDFPGGITYINFNDSSSDQNPIVVVGFSCMDHFNGIPTRKADHTIEYIPANHPEKYKNRDYVCNALKISADNLHKLNESD